MQMAPCHPERRHYAEGLCNSCYNGKRRREQPERLARYKRYAKNYRERHVAKNRAALRFYKYKMTQEQFDVLMKKQDNACAICKNPFGSEHTYRAIDTPNVDHDHITNKTRGLLCERCNIGLGGFRDTPEFLEAAIKYLQEYK